MNTSKLIACGLCLALTCGQALIARTARAADERSGQGGVMLLYVATPPAPIGTIDAPDFVIVNGRARAGRGAVWDGELLQVPPGASAQVSLTAVGRVTLAGGAVVQLGAVTTAAGAQAQRVLTAAVVSGEISVALEAEAGAWVQAGDQAFAASSGASFRLGLKNGRPAAEATRGTVYGVGSWALKVPEIKSEAMDARATERDALLHSIGRLSGSTGNVTAGQPLRLYTSPLAGMIGTIESMSGAGAMLINGRAATGRDPLWDGELIEAPVGSSARVTLDSIGHITLAGGTRARLLTATSVIAGQPPRRVLVAAGVTGAFSAQLRPDTAAWVEARGSIFAASPGAHFRISAQGPHPVAEASVGEVKSLGAYSIKITSEIGEVLSHTRRAGMKGLPHKYLIQPLGDSYHTSVRAGGTQAIRFRVTDEKAQVVAGLPIVFSLSAPDGQSRGAIGAGSESAAGYSAVTDANGVATAMFTAGESTGAVVINAAVPGTSAAAAHPVVVNGSSFKSARNAVPVLATVAAIAVAAIVVINRREDRLPIKGAGATQIIP